MEKWEYKLIIIKRGWERRSDDNWYHETIDWSSWTEDGKDLPKPVDMMKRLTKIGDEGWELVSVTPRSDYLGGAQHRSDSHAHGFGNVQAVSVDFAGYTTSEVWIFKRSK